MFAVLLLALILGGAGSDPSFQAPDKTQDKTPKAAKGLSADEVAFIEAARAGDDATVARYLNAGLDVNLLDKRDEELSTVLMVAAMAGKTETTKLLLEHGAKIDAKTKKGRTALTWASWRGMTDTVKALLAAGANVNTRDQWGSSPLGFAVSRGRTETVAVLLNAGAKTNFHHTESGQTVLIDAVVRGNIDVVRLLLENGADVNEQDLGGRKPVDFARKLNRVEIEVMLRRAAAK